ncbi:hypothetical protein ES703_124237 [subsurface metagenome]
MNKLPPTPPLPPLPPTEAFLPFPGEPDKAAELRLRGALRGFRAVATNIEHIHQLIEYPTPKVFRDLIFPEFPKLPPELEKKMEDMEEEMRKPGFIWSPEAVENRRKVATPLIEMEPDIKESLLAIERTFIEKGWHLPKWERPSWLLE